MSQPRVRAFLDAFELDVPIVQGPVGGAAGPELVSAVANAGGLGLLPIWGGVFGDVAARVRDVRARTERSFAVNVRADLVEIDTIERALDAGASRIHLFWGDPTPSMGPVRAAGAKCLVTVGDPDATKRALDAGADLLIAQGVEAGGHVLSETPLPALLESVLGLAGDVPVVAAGGLADADDVARVIAAGAAGALLGTRFVATRESRAHDLYKQALLDAEDDSTVRSLCFDGAWPDAPHRTLRNATYDAWEAAGKPAAGARPGEGERVFELGSVPFERYSVMHPVQGMTGDVLAGALYAGTGVARIDDCPPAAEVVARLASKLPDSRGGRGVTSSVVA